MGNGFWLGVIGTWILADCIASLWAYTGDGKRAKGQTFWRDHLLRIIRGIGGLALIGMGAVI